MGKVKKIYFSGEFTFNVKGGISYASEFLNYMEEMGVSSADIIQEKQERTTAENIRYLNELLSDKNTGTPILLISSGWHMRRCLKGFKNSGFKFGFLCRRCSGIHLKQTWTDYLSSWKAAQNWQKLKHEMFGMLII